MALEFLFRREGAGVLFYQPGNHSGLELVVGGVQVESLHEEYSMVLGMVWGRGRGGANGDNGATVFSSSK